MLYFVNMFESIYQDLFGELRLYAEKEYDEFPPEEGVWCLVCR